MDKRGFSIGRQAPLGSRIRRTAQVFLAAMMGFGPIAAAAEQDDAVSQQTEDEVFVRQTPATAPNSNRGMERPQGPARVYYPEEITPEASIAARERRAAPEQVARDGEQTADADLLQLAEGDDGGEVEQLSSEEGARALSQLSAAERQVLLEAVEGTDICERETDVPAIRALCADRIETRSAEFAQDNRYQPSAEERLLGEGLDGDRQSTLERAIERLARNSPEADDFSNQVLASVALDNARAAQGEGATGEEDPASELSAETQALINAIVEQFGGNPGGS